MNREEGNAREAIYFARRAQQHLDLAAAATLIETRIIHLDLASRYATQRELAERTASEPSIPSG